MRYEISAGGVVYQKINNEVFLLILKDKNNQWTFPKGQIEEGEKPEIAAQREVAEETGVKKVKLIANLTPIQYWYKFENNLVKKTVHYFLFQAQAEEALIPQTEEGIQEVKWSSLNDALSIIGYKKTNEKIINEVKEIINRSYSV